MVTGFHMGGESGWAQCEGPSDVGVVSTEVTSAAQASGSSFTFRCGGDRCHQYLSLSDECSHEGLGSNWHSKWFEDNRSQGVFNDILARQTRQ